MQAGVPGVQQKCSENMAYRGHVLAKALYDNTAEAPDELAFRKGDIVTVLEQNTGGLEGWWLCSLNGRQGIAPGNRLKLLAGIYESPNHPSAARNPRDSSPHKVVNPRTAHGYMTMQAPSTAQSSMEDYDVPPSRNQGNSPVYAAPPQRTVHTSPTHHGRTTPPGRRTPPGQEVYDTPPSAQRVSPTENYDVPPRSLGSGDSLNLKVKSGQGSPLHDTVGEIYDTPPSKREDSNQNIFTQDVYDVPPSQQKAKEVTASTLTPQDSVDTYDVPPSQQGGTELYDVIPPYKDTAHIPSPEDHYDTLPAQLQRMQTTPDPHLQPQKEGDELYDVPPNKIVLDELYDTPVKYGHEIYDQPPSSKGPRPGGSGSHNRNSDHVYDIPPTVTQDRPAGGPVTLTQHYRSADDITGSMNKLSLPQLSKSADCLDESLGRRLNLDRDAAMDLLVKRQQALDSAVAYMLSYVSSTWRHQNNLEPHIHEIRAACNQLKLAFKEFIEFAEGAIANALYVSDQTLHDKLTKQYKPLQDSHQIIYKASGMLDELKWDVSALMYKPGSNTNGELDTFAVTARGIPDDAKRFVVFVQGNASLLFKRAGVVQNRPLPTPPPSQSSAPSNWMAAERESTVTGPIAATRETIRNRPLPLVPSASVAPQQNHAHTNGDHTTHENGKGPDYGYVQKSETIPNHQIIVTDPPTMAPPPMLSPGDQQLLTFYYTEVDTLFTSLHNAIDIFFSCIDGNQPPKVFVAHSKHIILLGHKLVFIGDTLHHNLHNIEVRSRIIHQSDLLCDCLNVSVNATKNAALQFPAVQPLQEMVDRITDVASASRDLKETIMLNAPA